MNRIARILLIAVSWTPGAMVLGGLLHAGDWPQILGPHRNGAAVGERLLEKWPQGGPRRLWDYRLGIGFAGPVVVGEKVIVFHRVADNERIEAIDAGAGKRIWRVDFPAEYRGGYNADTGPRCTPVVHQGRVYVFGAAGDLHCVALADGDRLWSRAAYRDFGGDEGYFGAGSTPLVASGKVLVNVGGRRGAGIVAFDAKTGKTVWQATDEGASYSSPTLAAVGGNSMAVFVTRFNAMGVDPKTGRTYFTFPFGRRGPTVNAATPLVFDNHLFVSASYNIGARLAKIDGRSPQIVWDQDDVLSSQYATAVFRDGYLYGIDGREDIGVTRLRCVEAKTGRVMWTEEGFGVAHLILVGDKLLVLKVDGQLVLADASPAKYRQLASAKLAQETTRALPALSGGKLFLRTTSGDGGQLLCFHVGAEKKDD